MAGRGRGRGGQRPLPTSEQEEEQVVGPIAEERHENVDPIAEGLANVHVQHQTVLEASSSTLPRARGRGMRGAPMTATSPAFPVVPGSSRARGGRGTGGLGIQPEEFLGPLTSPSIEVPSTSQLEEGIEFTEQESAVQVASEQQPAQVEAEAAGTAQQGSSDGFRDVHIKRKEVKEPVIKIGTQGTTAKYAANFIRVKIAENKGYFEYRVDFNPQIDSLKTRKDLLKQCDNILGATRNYDGRNLLYLPIELKSPIPDISTTLPTDPNIKVTISVQFVKQLELIDCVQFYNVLLNSIQRILGLIEMSRNFYDARLTHLVPQHKLEIWPGYVTRIDEVDAGLMLCLDASHRVLQTTTVLELLEQIKAKERGNFKEKFKELVIGKLVVTKYKHDCYKIDDIAWNATPRDTFLRRNTEISFADYYKQQYDLTVTDLSQPLLVSKPKKRRQEKPGEARMISLIPEFCFMSGLSDDMTSNFTVMKDVATFTRISPQQRLTCLEAYMKKVNSTPDVQKLLQSWGIVFEESLVHVDGRILGAPDIQINQSFTLKAAKADFSRECTSNPCYQPIPLRNFIVICTKQDKATAEGMLKTYAQVCGPLGIRMGTPGRIMTVDRISPNDYRKVLKEAADPQTIQLVIVLLPSARDDLYGAVKQHCIVECPMPSQVILTKTVRNDKKVRSVMQKVALQINCKLGGAIWSLGIPVKNKIMFVGVDVYHDPKRKNPSVTALVATLDTKCTSYFSRVIYQKPHQETGDSIKAVFCLALAEFCEANGSPPDRIIVFRDGVSDGQWQFVKDTEVQQLMSAIDHMCQDQKPVFTFVVVQKRIPERFFSVKGNTYENPPPGSVLDHTINRKYYFDFFIVSQLVRQGTVSPTHFVVLEDTSNIKPDLMQKFAFATTYMYFNWPGTIRVPAMCQYAHKLAYLAGQHLKLEPNTSMDRLLYYL